MFFVQLDGFYWQLSYAAEIVCKRESSEVTIRWTNGGAPTVLQGEQAEIFKAYLDERTSGSDNMVVDLRARWQAKKAASTLLDNPKPPKTMIMIEGGKR